MQSQFVLIYIDTVSAKVPYTSRGTLHDQRDYSIIFKKDTDGEFTVLDIEPRRPPGQGQTCPVFFRLAAWILCFRFSGILLLQIMRKKKLDAFYQGSN